MSACHAILVRMVVDFDAELWIWDARRQDSWTFVTLPVGGIRRHPGPHGRSAAGVRVGPGTGDAGPQPLDDLHLPGQRPRRIRAPIKRAVRTAESLDVGDVATVTVELIDA